MQSPNAPVDGNKWILFGSILGFFAVGLGAFGAHGLRDKLSEKALATYQLATLYQMFHALALIGLGVWNLHFSQIDTSLAGWSFTVGCLVFSGSLYVLAVTGIGALGAITPIGGVAFLLGWLQFGYAVMKVMRS